MLADKCFMASLLKPIWRHQKLRYLAIGAWNTLAGYLIFVGLYFLLSPPTDYMIVAIISHILAVTHSFLTQRWIVFRSSASWKGEYLRFHIAHLGSLTIGLCLLPILIEIFFIPPPIAQGGITALIVVASYFVHQHFTFREPHDA